MARLLHDIDQFLRGGCTRREDAWSNAYVVVCGQAVRFATGERRCEGVSE